MDDGVHTTMQSLGPVLSVQFGLITDYCLLFTELVAAKGNLRKLIVFLDFGLFVHMRLLLDLGDQSG